ncbi:MAG: tetratricopeptide repeat protein [Dysgonamonadaceae bacterium]|jgi:tetratricopeptide (TPR) repeat protein|nr:tetratricopeptide repeat protein [Dysgonamonadaceae bacterium]
MQTKYFKSIICLAAFVWVTGIASIFAQQKNNDEELRRHIRYAQTAYNSGEYQDALDEYNEALKLAPQYPELYKAIGAVYEKLATTAHLESAITSYNRYIELAPDAPDVRQMKDKIYDLEYIIKKQREQDIILDDLSGEWVAIDNIEVSKIEDDGRIGFFSDFVFKITETSSAGEQKTGKFQIEMLEPGNRYYSANLIEKKINIVPAKNNSFTFTFADAVVHTPKSGGYNTGRFLGRILGSTTGADWLGELSDIAISTMQESDLPSNTQTAYAFALKYDKGKLVGSVNIVGKFADPTRQQTTANEVYKITFVKKDDKLRELLRATLDDKPEVINTNTRKDKWGNKLSDKEIAKRLYSFNPQLGKEYYKTKNTETAAIVMSIASIPVMATGILLWGLNEDNPQLITTGKTMFFSSLAIEIISLSVGISATSKKGHLVKQYNEQITQQHKQKPTAELRLGVTASGGLGLTLNF